MLKFFIQYKWFRSLRDGDTYVKIDGKWYTHDYYEQHMSGSSKITDVDGKWNSLAFCSCGNELTHSNSMTGVTTLHNNIRTFNYECRCCGTKQHWNPDVIPGLIQCDKDGNPLI